MKPFPTFPTTTAVYT